MPAKLWKLLTVLPFVMLLGACESTMVERGAAIDAEKLAKIEINKSTLPEVGAIVGSPAATNNFGEPTWYYISQEMEYWAFLRPEVTKQNIVIVRFDKGGVVQAVEQKDLRDAKTVEAVKQSTPTSESQMTILQQLLGNVGRFSGKESSK